LVIWRRLHPYIITSIRIHNFQTLFDIFTLLSRIYIKENTALNEIWNAFLRANNINNEDFYYRPNVKTMDQAKKEEPGLFTATDKIWLKAIGICT